MNIPSRFRQFISPYLDRLNLNLADPEALSQLAILGVISGIIAGAVMVAFRLLIEWPQVALLGPENPQDYEHLHWFWRLLLPSVGGLLLGLWFQRLSQSSRQVGVLHVMDGLSQREGLLPLKNASVQFFSAALCMVSGQSVGREGPSIHIGASCASWLGQQLQLPNNSIRVLVGCGSAGAIAAAFNTPLAGVIFTMEVILAEYTLSSFIPIILAAVSATSVSRWVFGAEPVFITPDIPLESLGELFYVVFMGIIIGTLSALFIRLVLLCSNQLEKYPLWQRFTLAGLVTGLIGIFVPEVLGIGYDTVNAALLGELGLALLLTLLLAKFAATTLSVGSGLPGGVIGPALMIGAIGGGAVGLLLNDYFAASTSPALYAMLGMGAMMGAVVNAPLAALTALLELTNNPHIILPGMLAIVAAGLSSRQLFATQSIFLHMLKARGLASPVINPLSQFLRRLGVSVSMDRRVRELPANLEQQPLKELLKNPPAWLLLRKARPNPQIIFTADLIRWYENQQETVEEFPLDLQALPIQRLKTGPISARATLLGALRKMERKKLDALYVVSAHSGRVLGIITRKAIERSYHNPY